MQTSAPPSTQSDADRSAVDRPWQVVQCAPMLLATCSALFVSIAGRADASEGDAPSAEQTP